MGRRENHLTGENIEIGIYDFESVISYKIYLWKGLLQWLLGYNLPFNEPSEVRVSETFMF